MTDAITAERAVPEPLLSAGVVYGDASRGGAIASARAFTAEFLAAAPAVLRGPVGDERVELAQLVVSELVTNAIRHTAGPCRLLLELGHDALEISVFDQEAAAPVPRGHDPRRIGQHGVEIVVAVCESLTVEPAPAGKRVRARLSLLPEPADPAPPRSRRTP
ncbi:ATP-binding protein [Streptomyces showdoensis]|uniref:Regulator n=1 Tax=Streptomyces showdoensis TaxID=68268 RepID=A0A2P2GH36_STREW|nr:ATP-binding protein [Streptomyces showdoensis]KKZ70830.1 regulator [Streptomyces showdoensis]